MNVYINLIDIETPGVGTYTEWNFANSDEERISFTKDYRAFYGVDVVRSWVGSSNNYKRYDLWFNKVWRSESGRWNFG